ncbi:MAG: J domain-containing protein, partial [Burkholderiaceae bacterium]
EQEQAIGTLMRAYLDLRRRYLHALHARSAQEHSAEQAEQAESVYQQYEQARSAMAQEPQPLPLDAQQQQDLKQLYRKLAMQCHPDRVGDQDKARAQELFQQLQLGYQNNDLARLAELQHAIGQRLAAAHSVAASDNAESLQRRLAQLQATLAQREQELAQLRRGPVWQTLRAQPVWATWFDQRAQQLQTEIRRYEIELAQVSHA